jgi:hypothetical protein
VDEGQIETIVQRVLQDLRGSSGTPTCGLPPQGGVTRLPGGEDAPLPAVVPRSSSQVRLWRVSWRCPDSA